MARPATARRLRRNWPQALSRPGSTTATAEPSSAPTAEMAIP